MKTLARIASALIAASALLFPLAAHAETRAPAGHHRHESAFPMKAESFKKLVDGRVDQLKGHLEQGLSRRSLTPPSRRRRSRSRWTAPSRSCTPPSTR